VHLIEEEQIAPEELDEITRLIKDKRRKK
jgi:hypothetical protein